MTQRFIKNLIKVWKHIAFVKLSKYYHVFWFGITAWYDDTFFLLHEIQGLFLTDVWNDMQTETFSRCLKISRANWILMYSEYA